jgi:hypothetical protein
MTRNAIAFVALMMLAGCEGPTHGDYTVPRPSPSPSAVTANNCITPPATLAPEATITMGLNSNQQTYCVQTGEKVNVLLSVPVAEADTSRWAPIEVSDRAVLEVAPNGLGSLVRGVTAGFFVARRQGACRLSSSRPTGQSWEAAILVQ